MTKSLRTSSAFDGDALGCRIDRRRRRVFTAASRAQIIAIGKFSNARGGLPRGIDQQGADGGRLVIGVQAISELFHGVGGDFNVGRQKKKILGLGGSRSDVHRLGCSEMVRQAENRDAGIFAVQPRTFVVAAAIDQQNLHPFALLRFFQRFDGAAQRGRLIVSNEDDGYAKFDGFFLGKGLGHAVQTA